MICIFDCCIEVRHDVAAEFVRKSFGFHARLPDDIITYLSMDGITMSKILVKLTEDSKLIKLVSALYIRSGNVNLRIQRNNAESV